jgi:hypothetical protein
MPKIDQGAKAWQKATAGRIGRAVATRRRKLKVTAAALADRTRELGYPISRVAMGKIENNYREGKFDVAEWLTLAAALDIPPMLLLLPGFPDDAVEILPGRSTESRKAAWWISGQVPVAGLRGDDVLNPGPGEDLVDHDDLVDIIDVELRRMQFELARLETAKDLAEATEQLRHDVGRHEKLLAALRVAAKVDRDELWGTR